jgi:hypothetical protein
VPLVRKPNISQSKSVIRQAGREGVKNALISVEERHAGIVSTWKKGEDRPDFVVNIEYKNRLVIGTVKVEGQKAESASITVWQLLEHGTRIRFMQLSEDWISKTQPGRLSGGAGQGHKLGLDLKNPQPGILPRNWAKGVAEDEKDFTDTYVREGWSKGFRQAIGR